MPLSASAARQHNRDESPALLPGAGVGGCEDADTKDCEALTHDSNGGQISVSGHVYTVPTDPQQQGSAPGSTDSGLLGSRPGSETPPRRGGSQSLNDYTASCRSPAPALGAETRYHGEGLLGRCTLSWADVCFGLGGTLVWVPLWESDSFVFCDCTAPTQGAPGHWN